MNWEQLLFFDFPSSGQLILRITLAAALWPHGAQKVLGLFGGPGWKESYAIFTQKVGIPAPLAVIAMLTEFLAPLFLVLGLFTHVAALAVMIQMLVAMSMHVKNGFFINWHADQKGEGIEYHILYAGAALGVFLMGAGDYSLDAVLKNMLFK